MANGATEIMKARQKKRTQGGRKGAASNVNRSKARIADPKRRRSNDSANPQKSFERYIALARDAASSGDAVESQNYYQHAEHYLRLMAAS